MLLQFCAAASGVEIWSGDEDAGDAGWVGDQAIVVTRYMHGRGGREVLRCRQNGGRIYSR